MLGIVMANLEAVSAVNDEIPPVILVIVTAIGGLVTLVILALMCTECIGRLRDTLRRQTEQEQQDIQPLPRRRSRPTAAVPIAHPRQIVEQEIESPPRPFSEVLRDMYRAYRRMSQTSAEGYQVEDMNIERAEEVLNTLHARRPPTPHVRQLREVDPPSEELDRYSVITNGSDMETSTYVERMNEVGQELAAGSADEAPGEVQPLLFGSYRPPPPLPYYQVMRVRDRETPPPTYAWALDHQRRKDKPSPVESRKSSSSEELQFRMSMSSKSDDSKGSNPAAAAAAPTPTPLSSSPQPVYRRPFSLGRSSPIQIPQESVAHFTDEITQPRIAMGLAILHRAVEGMKRMSNLSPTAESPEPTAKAAQGDDTRTDPNEVVSTLDHPTDRIETAAAVVGTKTKAIDVKDLIQKTKDAMNRAIAIASTTVPKGANSRAIVEGRMAEPEGAISRAKVEGKMAESGGAISRAMDKRTNVDPKDAADWVVVESTSARDDLKKAWTEMRTIIRRRSREESSSARAEIDSAMAERRRSISESAVVQVTNDEIERAWAEMKATMSRSKGESAKSQAKEYALSEAGSMAGSSIPQSIEYALAEERSRLESAISQTIEYALAEARSRVESAKTKDDPKGATGGVPLEEGALAQADAPRADMGGAKPKDSTKKKKKKAEKDEIMRKD